MSFPHTPSLGSPEFLWKSQSARMVSGPKIPSTRPQSKPRRVRLPWRSTTSSPRRFGAVNWRRRSPRRQPASTSADQVAASHSPVSERCRERWNSATAAVVDSPKRPSSTFETAKPREVSRRWRSRTASPAAPEVSGNRSGIRRTPGAGRSCSWRRRSGDGHRLRRTTTSLGCSSPDSAWRYRDARPR